MLETRLDWESCEWECTCGHVFHMTYVGDEFFSDVFVHRYKVWCNNCAVSRYIFLTEPSDEKN